MEKCARDGFYHLQPTSSTKWIVVRSLKNGSGFYSSTVDQCTDRLATKPHLERDRVPFCTLILFDYFRSLFSIFLDHDSFLGLLIYTLPVYE